jgi:hypothetical protein
MINIYIEEVIVFFKVAISINTYKGQLARKSKVEYDQNKRLIMQMSANLITRHNPHTYI